MFVCHASVDAEVAQLFVAQAESKGIRCWIAPRDVPPSTDYGASIMQAIGSCHLVLLLFSSSAGTSPHVLREVDRAIAQDRVIVPVHLDSAPLNEGMEYRLCTVQWLDEPVPPAVDSLVGHITKVLEAVRLRDRAPGGLVYLNRCRRCGAQYDENSPSGCSFHPGVPHVIGNTGPRYRNYADVYEFDCCGQRYVATLDLDGHRDALPPQSPGCVDGQHIPRHLFS